MSKIGSAVQWIQENNLQDDPNALKKYIKYGHTKYKPEQRKNTENISNGRSVEPKGGMEQSDQDDMFS